MNHRDTNPHNIRNIANNHNETVWCGQPHRAVPTILNVGTARCGCPKISKTTLLLLILAVLLFTACNSPQTVQPTSDALLIDGYMPKLIITIALTPTLQPITPIGEEIAAEATAYTPPTSTPAPTQTPTPYVGVFLGEPTRVSDDGEIILPPTIPPLVIPAGGSSGIVQAPSAPPASSAAPGSTGQVAPGACTINVAEQFATAYSSHPALQSLGCPVDGGLSISLVVQPFERGQMYWRDTRQIFVLAGSGTYWRTTDSWNDTLPADDPALTPPNGLLQPVRGFGYAWRNNQGYRDALGWATEQELMIASYWQEFQGGSLFLGRDGLIYAVPSGETGTFTGGITP